ncbi:MAG: hypothetical protein ACI8S6_001718 [Myxococcota bacterium]
MTRLLSVAALWLAANLAWLHTDRLLRDGDEEGHVGAAELMLELIHTEGPLSFVAAAIAGDYGEYPPLYPALVAAWWWLMGSGQPGSFEVRAVGLLWPLISATAKDPGADVDRREALIGEGDLAGAVGGFFDDVADPPLRREDLGGVEAPAEEPLDGIDGPIGPGHHEALGGPSDEEGAIIGQRDAGGKDVVAFVVLQHSGPPVAHDRDCSVRGAQIDADGSSHL